MNVQTETTIIYVLRLTEQDLTDALIAPAALQEALRAAHAAHRASDDTRRGNIAFGEPQHRVDSASIARSAKKQNAKIKAKRFLAQTRAGAFPCDQCDKTFDKQRFLNIHKSRMHKNGSLPARSTTPTPPPHHGNTFPVSAADVESDIP